MKKQIQDKRSTGNSLAIKDAEYGLIRTNYIKYSPLNYRKYFSEEALEAFADELKQHGMISPVTVRLADDGKYELVAGERRLRAARLAGLEIIPAQIADLTDEQVIEIQLSENLQREDPHPMHEAQAIGQMQKAGKSIDEISFRLGKSKQFVYTRVKLLSLNESFQEMVFADVISLQDALQIATLSETSQSEFYEDHCSKWKKDKHFSLHNVAYYLNQYRYDLKRAPFNIKDKNLIPEVGACTGCSSNSASLKTLFPEYAKQSVCFNKECYNKKCSVHLMALLQTAIQTYQPEALIYNNRVEEITETILSLIPAAINLPKHNYGDITVIIKPQYPDKEDYTYDDEVEEEEYNSAMEEYYRELEIYNLHIQSGQYKIALMLSNKTFEPAYFSLEKPRHFSKGSNTVSAKEIQAAIKSGNVTAELLQSEIERLNTKEKRAKEIDREKIQLLIHQQLNVLLSDTDYNSKLTFADNIAARLLIYESLDYSSRSKVNEILFYGRREDTWEISFYDQLAALNESQYSFMIRMAIAGQSDSKFPFNDTGKTLYVVAKEAGISVNTIEEAQEQKRKEREEKLLKRIEELNRRIAMPNKADK